MSGSPFVVRLAGGLLLAMLLIAGSTHAAQDVAPDPVQDTDADDPNAVPDVDLDWLDPVVAGLQADDADVRESARLWLEKRALAVTEPEDRAKLTVALAEATVALDNDGAARALLVWIQRIGGSEAVPILAPALFGPTPRSEDVRRTFVQLGGASAEVALLHACLESRDVDTRVSLIRALGERSTFHPVGDAVRESLHAFVEPPGVGDDESEPGASADEPEPVDPRVLLAVYDALARMGTVADVPRLWAGLEGVEPTVAEAGRDSVLRLAERLASEEPDRLAEVLGFLGELPAPPSARRSLCRIGLGIDPSGAYSTLRRRWLARDSESRAWAELLPELPATHVDFMVQDALAADDEAVREEALRALLVRADRVRWSDPIERAQVLHDPTRSGPARRLALACLQPTEKPTEAPTERDPRVPSARVKALAIQVIADYATHEVVDLLADWASRTSRDDAEVTLAAREGLASLSFRGSNEALLATARGSEDTARKVQLVRVIGERGYEPATPYLLEWATTPGEKAVRVGALRALAPLVKRPHLGPLITALQSEPDRTVRDLLLDRVVGICLRDLEPARRSESLIAAYPAATSDGKVAILEGLQRTAGSGALDVVRDALAAGEGAVADAAFKALTRWSDRDALPVLLRLVRGDDSRQRLRALHAYVGLLGKFPTNDLVARLRDVETHFDVALRRRALAVVSAIPSAEALVFAQEQRRREDVVAESDLAIAKIARLVLPLDPDRAEAAIAGLLGSNPAPLVRAHAEETRRLAANHPGFVGAWLASGPYERPGKGPTDLLEIAFPPEAGRGEWVAFGNAKSDNPWLLDLSSLSSAANQVVYLSCEVYAEADGPCEFAVGSDDGVKVWVNGALVHENNVTRAHQVGSDRFTVRLRQGWNPIRAKVSQGGGGWEFSLQLRRPDGTPWPRVTVRH